jgi:hypothetical protein
MKLFFSKIQFFIIGLSIILLISCGGGGNVNGTHNASSSAPIGANKLLGKVFKIVDFIDIASSVMDLINNETQECGCKNDYAYIVASSDRRKGVEIYIDDEYVGEADRKQAFLKVVSPGTHSIIAKDNRRDRKWERTVTLDNGGIELLSFNREDWEKDDD